MFLSDLLLLCFFGLCVVKLEDHTYIMTVGTICSGFMYLSGFVDGVVVLCFGSASSPSEVSTAGPAMAHLGAPICS